MFHDLVSLVLPASCAGCRAPGVSWCIVCAGLLVAEPGPVVPSPPPPGFPSTVAAGEYDGVFREALLAHKEHRRRAVRPALGRALAAAIEVTAAGGRAVVVPVPSGPAAIRARGGDPVGAMSAVAARRAGAVFLPALELRRRLADQAGLDTARRATNLAGAFDVRPRAAGRLRALAGAGVTVVVVDDVCTTGATLAEAARALRGVGLAPRAAVVAATRKRHPRSGGLPPARAGPTLSA